MNRGPLVHGVLLILALGLAYQTWTRDKAAKPKRGDVVVWQVTPADIVAVNYDTERKTVRVERRKDGADEYLWGIVTRTSTPPPKPKEPKEPADDGKPADDKKADDGKKPADDKNKKPADDKKPADGKEPAGDAQPAGDGHDHGDHAADGEAPAEPADAAEPTPAPETVTREFPVGEAGTEMFEALAPLRALRDLGVPTDEQRTQYELADAKTQLTVHFKDRSRSLLIGGRVYGGSDRYVLDPESGHAYVLPGETLRSLEGADASLRERRIVPAEPEAVATVTLRTPEREVKLVRGEKKPKPDDPHGAAAKPTATWAYADSPDHEDQTLANFMDRLEKLAPMEFEPEVAAAQLTSVVRIEYFDKAGKNLGYLELVKTPGEPKPDGSPGEFEYYVISPRTRVHAKVHRLSAQRVNKDLEQLFAPAE